MSEADGDRRLIEDLLPVDSISAVSVSEKVGGRKGHPALLHLWWARRPLAAARAAVYATLVRVEDTPPEQRSDEFFRSLCQWGASDTAIAEARARVVGANGGTPPRVLDLFAGGGAIPLEAARLGCDATAVELNPVAHLIELCTLDYPQRFGPSLADDVREYGRRWVEHTWVRVGHLYPQVREPQGVQQRLGKHLGAERVAGRPIAYLWTRTVPCPNTAGGAHDLPLVRQTWLAKKKGRYVALRPVVDRTARSLSWEVIEAQTSGGLGFDPAGFSSRGRASCLICGAAVDAKYVKSEGLAGRMGITPLAAVVVKPSGRGRDYLPAGMYEEPSVQDCEAVINGLDVGAPEEPVCTYMDAGFRVAPYGLTRFRDLFTPRQLATLCAFAHGVREMHAEMLAGGMERQRAEAVSAYLGLVVDRLADWGSCLCRWHPGAKQEGVMNTFARQVLPMVWDLAESNPFGGSSGDAHRIIQQVAEVTDRLARTSRRAECYRASATQLSDYGGQFDAVITDPPYYDNISYADLSDFFYVWLKRSVGFLFEDDFAGELTPKRREITSFAERHAGATDGRVFYTEQMAAAFAEAHRVLKPGAPLVCVYAHKTTLGWAALVEALRRARFTITEAWPLDTEMPERSRGQNSAALASSIFLVARRRDHDAIGAYHHVVAELDGVIAERLDRLTAAGVAGSDLVIASIGAGLRPFTRFAAVELPSGEPVSADRFLEEVQSRVLDAVLAKVHDLGAGVGAIDLATRYYVLARTMFAWADIDFDEANNLARTAGVELGDGLSRGPLRLADVSGKSVHLRDFAERGGEADLGLDRTQLVDVLHGLLWRAAHRSTEIPDYLDATRPDPERLRAVAQALQGRALRGQNESKAPEAQACERLLGSWRTLVDDNLLRNR